MTGRSGERGSGISVLAMRHDDDDDDDYKTVIRNEIMYLCVLELIFSSKNINIFVCKISSKYLIISFLFA